MGGPEHDRTMNTEALDKKGDRASFSLLRTFDCRSNTVSRDQILMSTERQKERSWPAERFVLDRRRARTSESSTWDFGEKKQDIKPDSVIFGQRRQNQIFENQIRFLDSRRTRTSNLCFSDFEQRTNQIIWNLAFEILECKSGKDIERPDIDVGRGREAEYTATSVPFWTEEETEYLSILRLINTEASWNMQTV